MFQTSELKIIFRVQSTATQFRRFSTQPPTESKFKEEWNSAKPFESIPKVSKFQLIRNFAPGGKYYDIPLIEMHKSIRKEFGDISRFPGMFGQPPMVITYDAKNFEKVFRAEGHFPYRRGFGTLIHYRKNIRPEIYGEYGGLVTVQNEEWHKMRTLVNPVLLRPKTVKLYIPQVDEIAQEFIQMIMKKRDGNNEVPADFGDFVNKWSLESITCISLNRRLGILDENYRDKNAEKLIKLIREFFIYSADFEIKPTIWRYYETKAFKRLLSVYDGMTNIIMEYIEQAVEELKSRPHEEGREESILEKLLKVNKKVAITMSADALIAGVDTTSSAVIGILYCLAKNPEKQDKLREELRQILPNKNDALTPEKMTRMPYLRAVIKEGIRMYSPVVGNVRNIKQDLVLSGYQVPKDKEVVMSNMVLHEDESQFERSGEFIPERWLKDNTETGCPHAKDSHPFAYLPFGFGPRMCVGRRIAELEIEALITRLIRDFKIEWNHPPMKIKSVILNIPDGDLKFKFTEM